MHGFLPESLAAFVGGVGGYVVAWSAHCAIARLVRSFRNAKRVIEMTERGE